MERLRNMSASRLSVILIAAMCVLLALLIGGSAYVTYRLLNQATAATHARIDADVSADDQSRYEALKQYLETNSTGIAQTAGLTAGLGSYSQSSIVATINGYAAKAGVTITNFDFGDATAGAAATAGNNTVTVTLNSPVKYTNFVIFLRLVEHGLMPAQVVSGTVGAAGTNSDSVNVSQLGIKVVQ